MHAGRNPDMHDLPPGCGGGAAGGGAAARAPRGPAAVACDAAMHAIYIPRYMYI